MHILIVDRSGAIPAVNYGGTERVIWGLAKCLVDIGHTVSFLVPEGSTCDFANVLLLDQEKDLNEQIPDDVDVVHFNYNPLQHINKPYIITMHGNPSPTDPVDVNTVFISKNQAYRFNSNIFVYNGLYWDDFPKPNFNIKREGFHFIGKVSWKVKNVFGAIGIALKLKEKIQILGGHRLTYRNLKRNIFKTLNPKVKFKGFVNDHEKMTLMNTSKGLIFPVEWHEPFGLAIIESLYAGCAVFGTTNGSLPEIMTNEVGYTSNSILDIAEKIASFKFDPQRCHNYAKDKFNAHKMTESYIVLYKQVLNGNKLHQESPRFIKKRHTVNTLKK